MVRAGAGPLEPSGDTPIPPTIHTLLDTDPDLLDAAWEAHARALAPEERATLLERSDALRAGDMDDRHRARAVLMALKDDLFPSRPRDAERLRFLFLEEVRRGPEMEALAASAEQAGPPDLRPMARLVRAQCAADAGRTAEAHALLRSVLADVRGQGGIVESYALRSLVWLSLRHFREFEALTLARRALRIAESASSAADAALATLAIASTLRALEDWPRLEATLDGLAAMLEGAPPDAWHARGVMHGLRAEALLRRGRVDEARDEVARVTGSVPRGATPPWDPRWPHYLEAETFRRAGRPAEALDAVRRSEALPSRIPSTRLRMLLCEAQACLELGDAAAARAAATGLVDLLFTADPETIGPGLRIRYGAQAGDLLRERLADADGARRAYEAAGEAVLQRLGQLHRTLPELPELSEVEEEDLRILSEYRERVQAEHGEILSAVAIVLDDALRTGRLAAEGFPSGSQVLTLCAWCSRVRAGATGWHPIGAWLPTGKSLRISHGICPECLRGMAHAG
jgi:hypothetical protein